MTTASDSRTLAERIFGALTRAYPADFRQAYGPELLEFFRADRQRAARSPIALAAFWPRTITDLLRSAVRQRRAVRRNHHRAPQSANRGREFMNSVIHDIRTAARALLAGRVRRNGPGPESSTAAMTSGRIASSTPGS